MKSKNNPNQQNSGLALVGPSSAMTDVMRDLQKLAGREICHVRKTRRPSKPSETNEIKPHILIDLNEFFARGNASPLFIMVTGHPTENIPVADGDWVVIDQKRSARENDIVIAFFESGPALRRYRHSKDASRKIMGVITWIFHSLGPHD